MRVPWKFVPANGAEGTVTSGFRIARLSYYMAQYRKRLICLIIEMLKFSNNFCDLMVESGH